MKGHLDAEETEPELESLAEEWTPERLRKRSEELHLIDCQGNIICRNKELKVSKTIHEETGVSDNDPSPSKSTSESQVTVRSSPIMPESLPVCRQCHKSCLNSMSSRLSNENSNNSPKIVNKQNDVDAWGSLFLMGLSAVNPAASLVHIDPFVPNNDCTNTKAPNQDISSVDRCSENCQKHELHGCHSYESTPDDSPQSEEHPYHSLSSSNLTIRRFGTVPSLERLGTDDGYSEKANSSESEDEENVKGLENPGFNGSSELTWTAKAGMFVAEKMAFLEKLGEDYRATGGFFQRYLKASDEHLNGEEIQEEETSGGTSGEDIWGTPTSGGEFDDFMNSPNYDGKQSPNDGSISSDYNDDTELMMDELLMTPPITGAIIRGLLPRRTLEPLIEEDISESNSSSPSVTPTEQSSSSHQDSEAGNAADTCSAAAESPIHEENTEKHLAPSATDQEETLPRIPRSLSYRKIVERPRQKRTISVSSADSNRQPDSQILIKYPNRKVLKYFNFSTCVE
ncbi:hypothetical protein WA026_014425 [Henosepilachna vigintioctopunctata]|uniref:Uncharacterized protein n=1 Tax=Henosepilachna vigintioctopunctata TaxID=420089 RepID=A0AAW1UBS4_9CUCU